MISMTKYAIVISLQACGIATDTVLFQTIQNRLAPTSHFVIK